MVNGIMYVLSTGCQWRCVPKDLPPKSTLHDYLDRWNYDGTVEKIHHALYVKCREQLGREASPTACESGRIRRRASRCYQSAGSSNAVSPASADAAGWQRTSRT
jgi:transposase